jgi:hypothetical protein
VLSSMVLKLILFTWSVFDTQEQYLDGGFHVEMVLRRLVQEVVETMAAEHRGSSVSSCVP